MNLPLHKYGKTERRKFGKINEVIDIPDLVEIQKSSYDAFMKEGITEVFIFSNIGSTISPSTTSRSAATATLLTPCPCT